MAGKTINAWGETWATPVAPKESPAGDRYITVPDEYRNFAPLARRKAGYNREVTPLIEELVSGKTVLVDAQIPAKRDTRGYRNLYAALAVRGYRLTMFVMDDVDHDIYRGLLMYAEPMLQLWHCSFCGRLEMSPIDNKPPLRRCKYATTIYKNHMYRKVNNTKNMKEVKRHGKRGK